ncbi:MAG TPA: peroxiredoxin [Desulfosalsimonadaceae bacterium]|nr:peroxiredoxin [Desulfosalsimonadaceae bacterium]
MKKAVFVFLAFFLVFSAARAWSQTHSDAFAEKIYDPGKRKPTDSRLKVELGEKAPDFTLPAISGDHVTLSQYRGEKNVVLSFVPAAWTPVCSDQWPGYNIVEAHFAEHDALLLGISVDNIPSLHAWTQQMGTLWFPVLSDFWPHGAVAEKYGILRPEGISERALFVIDKKGIIRYISVYNINKRPPLENLLEALERLKQ